MAIRALRMDKTHQILWCILFQKFKTASNSRVFLCPRKMEGFLGVTKSPWTHYSTQSFCKTQRHKNVAGHPELLLHTEPVVPSSCCCHHSHDCAAVAKAIFSLFHAWFVQLLCHPSLVIPLKK